MFKRLFDLTIAGSALIVAAPIIVLAALGVKLSSKGPAFYLAQRAGQGGTPFTLFKLRTMHIHQAPNASAITAASDSRVFKWGAILRKTKIDELPQLWNIIRGDMSIVGPRPEDMINVERFYSNLGHFTLTVKPGLSGVGSIYYYTHGEKLLDVDNPEEVYARDLLPIKLALEAVYIRRMSVAYDAQIVVRTAIAILKIAAGTTNFAEIREMPAAQKILNEFAERAAA